jgi:hypothetical protein
MHAEERHGFEGDGFVYLRSPIWWAGIICCTGRLGAWLDFEQTR